MKNIATITEIAEQLNIPRTTLNEWKQQYDEFLPSVGKGRSKRYYIPDSIEVFKRIAELRSSHESKDILRMLQKEFPINIVEVLQDQDQEVIQVNHMLQDLVSELKKSNELKEKELQLRQIEIQEQQQFREDVTRRLERRNQEVEEMLLALRETQQNEVAASSEITDKKWWEIWK